jgi:glycosyltransferase involved in cell wall biosynthesis
MNNSDMPKVSIGIPSYNRPDMLRRAVQSALDQDYENLEVVVCDDASPDPVTLDVLREFEENERFCCQYCDVNLGLVGNWQRCLAMATGDLWLSLPNDDWLEPNAISRMVREFDDPKVGLVLCARYAHSERGDEVVPLPGSGVVSGREFITHRLHGKCGFPPTELYRLDLVRECGGYHDIGYAMDLMLELDIGARSKIAYVNEPLTHHGCHAATASVAHPIQTMTTLVILAELAPERYSEEVASEIYASCVRGLYGRTIDGALNRNREQTQTGCDGLKALAAPRGIQVKAAVFNNWIVRHFLYWLRQMKRRIFGRRVS